MVHNNKFCNNENKFLAWNFKKHKAYHFDAFKFGQELKRLVAIPNGVKHIQDTVVSIAKDSSGNISNIVTKNNGSFSSDLYIDCTGFKSQLLGKTLDVPFKSFKDKLLNDKAVVANIPYRDKDKELTSWTECTAHDSGWFWNIPVWDRIGTGYVYSSKHVDDFKAQADFKQHLKIQFGDRADTATYSFINFEPGMREKAWSNNVIGIGLSCGFIEPLRSTGLHITQIGITKLVNILARANNNVKNIDREIYSDFMSTTYSSIRDLVLLQYIFSDRSDTPYWEYMTNQVSIKGDESDFFNELQFILKYNQIENTSEFVKILGGVNRTPLSDYVFNSIAEQEDFNTQIYKDLFENWKLKDQKLQEHAETLPTLLEYLEKNIYNT
jgi:tryptophan halogenase